MPDQLTALVCDPERLMPWVGPRGRPPSAAATQLGRDEIRQRLTGALGIAAHALDQLGRKK